MEGYKNAIGYRGNSLYHSTPLPPQPTRSPPPRQEGTNTMAVPPACIAGVFSGERTPNQNHKLCRLLEDRYKKHSRENANNGSLTAL